MIIASCTVNVLFGMFFSICGTNKQSRLIGLVVLTAGVLGFIEWRAL